VDIGKPENLPLMTIQA